MLKRKFIPSPLESGSLDTRPPPEPIRTWRVLFVAWFVVRVVWWVWRMRRSTSQDDGAQRTPLELGKLVRHELERLGGLWVKTAHVIAARRDVFPIEFCDELLQTRAWPIGTSGDVAKDFVEHELGRPINDMFREFDVVPVATTAIGQVHVAWLRERDVKVAIKIQRANIQTTFARDLDILQALSKLLQFFHVLPRKRIQEIRADIERIFAVELDYGAEATAMRHMRRELKTNDVYVPKVFSRLCSRRVLVTEFVDGVLVSDYQQAVANNPRKTKKWCRDNRIRPRRLLRRIAGGDLGRWLSNRGSQGVRPGHLMMLRQNHIALIDFGVLGVLDHGSACIGVASVRERSLILRSHPTEEHHAQIFEPAY